MDRSVPKTRLVAALVAALLVVPALGSAQGPRVLALTTFTTDVPLVTTAETVVVTSPVRNTPRDEAEVLVICWTQLTTGASTTTVTPRVRRGSTATGTLVGEANAVTLGAAAGSTEQFIAVVSEQRAATSLEYSCTLQQASASGNGSALHGAIAVLAR
jgi:ABC-type glycerol-3-phosphate transport system substrate-binding protein